jgi:uncharacterized membrane protein
LLGPAAIAVSLSEALNLDVLANVPAYFVYFNGTLLFVAGLSIVRAHNYWKLGWQLLITLMGWFLILLGTARMFAPERASQAAHQSRAGVYGSILALLLAGAVMTGKAHSRRR